MPVNVNSQITDSVTQVNTKVLGETPAMAMGNLMLGTSQALGCDRQYQGLAPPSAIAGSLPEDISLPEEGSLPEVKVSKP
ncbi:RebB family R body protein [Shewanella sp. AS16]|uniref:RebB family R body protein n=1 Tax=Shewanella sp. AS16 TaxID=2907625 RepID=UPI001F46029E|nr:RebB family R body protein [Shewanella sp. AS16]MCE9687639.1 RebB family R body protein [Shewanella sp. AS16]